MPTVEQILIGLKEVANNWRTLAVFWHIFYAVFVIVLIVGSRPSKRIAGFLIGLPLFSVSAVAWASSNPFNGIVFALIGILFVYFSTRLPREKARLAPGWIIIPGAILFIFGWVYPHFLETTSFLSYLYSAPTGLIPCATLSIVIGMFLILDALGSLALSLVLGLAGLFYGFTGVFQLKVSIDLVLLLGGIMTLTVAFKGRRQNRTS